MYIYKKVTKNPYDYYVSLHSKWLERRPQEPDGLTGKQYSEMSPAQRKLFDVYLGELDRWSRKEPQIEYSLVEPSGSYCVEICVGLAPTRLLFHQRFTKGFPYVPFADVLSMAKRRHVHWEGLSTHTLRVNLYEADSLRNLHQLEVDLWQDIPDVTALVEPVLQDLRTARLIPKVFRF